MKSKHPLFKVPNKETEEKINGILSRLSIEQKIDMLSGQEEFGNTLPIESEGIPSLKMADGPVGVHWWTKASTAYPALIMLAATFNKELSYQMGKALGLDCRARGVHILLAPGVNIYRSPLCGRNFEYMGEDPALASDIVCKYIEGLQDERVSATVKHYALNNQEYARHDISSDVDERTMREVYLPAFEAAVKKAGTGALMTAYNLVNGRHCSEHDYLNNTILKEEWGFDGVAMSDWNSVYCHVGPANGGLDLEMPFAKFLTKEKLIPAIKQGLVSEEKINDKVRRLLRLIFAFAWDTNPIEDKSIPEDNPETVEVALNVAREGLVLLKNENNVLPFKKEKIKKIALIGHHAKNAVICGGGSAYTPPFRSVSIEEAVRNRLGSDVTVTYAEGFDVESISKSFKNSVFTADGKNGLKAKYYSNATLSGEAICQTDEHIAYHWAFKEAPLPEGIDRNNFSVCWEGNLKYDEKGYQFYLKLNDAHCKIFIDDKEVFSYQKGIRVGSLFEFEAESSPEAKIRIEFKRTEHWAGIYFGYVGKSTVSNLWEEATKIAKEADAVILACGYTKDREGEGEDRIFALPEDQNKLISEVCKVNANTAVVMHAGGNVDMREWIDNTNALLYTWYPGQEGGEAVAEVLFGEIAPSGRLPITMERNPEDGPAYTCYHDKDDDMRTLYEEGIFVGYRHYDKNKIKPLFPFGYGLTYTSFSYGELKLSQNSMDENGIIKASIDVTNTGKVDAYEVIQFYISDKESTHIRPEKELKGFDKVFIKAGESKEFTFEITKDALRYFNPDEMKWVYEKGEFEVKACKNALEEISCASFSLM